MLLGFLSFPLHWTNNLQISLASWRCSSQGPRRLPKQKQLWRWSTGIIPPPFDVSIDSNMDTTSSISGRLSALASQHRFITFAKELGQQRGISGLKFCKSKAELWLLKIFFLLFNEQKCVIYFYLSDNSCCHFREAQIWIWHVTAIYLPEANAKAIYVTLPVIRVAIKNLSCRPWQK